MDSHECVASEVRTCSKCGERKDLKQFGQSKGKPKPRCLDCERQYQKEYYKANRQRVLDRTAKYKADNPDKVKEMMADWYERNKDNVKNRCAEYRSRPEVAEHEKQRSKEYYEARKYDIQAKRKAKLMCDPEKLEKLKEYGKEHYRNNKHIYQARVGKRRTRVEQATPKWANLEAIKVMYYAAHQLSEMTGIKYHVDHVIPLHGKNVCGLHVESNLEIVPAVYNLTKSNKF